MVIQIYIPGQFVYIQSSNGEYFEGLWCEDETQEYALRKNVKVLIDTAIKLPVTRVTLEI